ncbi:hypothetical protein TYRP_009509 [Tyrophagus putrescentiae]|nr:hypothetical protein TYRP_009509 [Tyrophagus putrescentiae]
MRVSAVLGHTVSRRSAVPQLTAARPVWKAAPLLLLVAHVADASSLLVAAGKEAQTFLAVTAAATLPPGRRPAARAPLQAQIIGEVGVADAAAPVAVREGAKLSLAISHLAAGGLLTELRAAVPSLFVAHLADASSLGVAGGVWAQVQAALLVRAAGVVVLTGGRSFIDATFWGPWILLLISRHRSRGNLLAETSPMCLMGGIVSGHRLPPLFDLLSLPFQATANQHNKKDNDGHRPTGHQADGQVVGANVAFSKYWQVFVRMVPFPCGFFSIFIASVKPISQTQRPWLLQVERRPILGMQSWKVRQEVWPSSTEAISCPSSVDEF